MGQKGRQRKAAKGALGKLNDRNYRAGPWMPMAQLPVPPEVQETGIVAMFQNNKFRVYVKPHESTKMPKPDGTPSALIQLIITPMDKKREPKWDEYQKMKNEICGPECEGAVLCPAETRRLGDIAPNQFHLWVTEPGLWMPFGLIPKALQQQISMQREVQKIEDRDVFVVFRRERIGDEENEDGSPKMRMTPAEVFADEDEAREKYGDKLDEEPTPEFSTKVCMIDEIPPPDWAPPEGHVGADWTEAAVKRQEVFLEKLNKILGFKKAEEPEDILPGITDDTVIPEDAEIDPDLAADLAFEHEQSGAAAEERAAKEAEESEAQAKDDLAEMREKMRAERKAKEEANRKAKEEGSE